MIRCEYCSNALWLQKKHIGVKGNRQGSEIDDNKDVQKKRELGWKYSAQWKYQDYHRPKGSKRKSQGTARAIREEEDSIISPCAIYPFKHLPINSYPGDL